LESALRNLVVFDIDGTLLDSVAVHQAALASAIEATDLAYRDTVWSNYANHTDSGVFWEAYVRSLGREPDGTQCGLFESSFAGRYEDLVAVEVPREIPGARRMLERMKSSEQWRVAFATGSFRRAAEHKLRLLGIEPDSAVLVTATEFRTRREIVASAVQRSLGPVTSPAELRVVSVGDGPWDARTAAELAIAFIGVAEGVAGQRLQALGAQGVVPHYGDIKSFLHLLDTAGAPPGNSNGDSPVSWSFGA
jgi:phosphoglycolate phosphatase-like HAD superfamily hydrolase